MLAERSYHNYLVKEFPRDRNGKSHFNIISAPSTSIGTRNLIYEYHELIMLVVFIHKTLGFNSADVTSIYIFHRFLFRFAYTPELFDIYKKLMFQISNTLLRKSTRHHLKILFYKHLYIKALKICLRTYVVSIARLIDTNCLKFH